jgi:hypothetical protein
LLETNSSPIATIVVKGSAMTILVVAFLGLLSWFIDEPTLRGLAEPQLQMKVNTAIGFLLSALSLLALTVKSRRAHQVGHVFAALTVFIGAATLFQYLYNINLGIDEFFVRDPLNQLPGRMVPASAVNFILKGLALLTLDYETRRGYRPSQFLSIISMIAPMQVLFALAHGPDALVSVGAYSYII